MRHALCFAMTSRSFARQGEQGWCRAGARSRRLGAEDQSQASFVLAWGQSEADMEVACRETIRHGQSHGDLLSTRVDMEQVTRDFHRIRSSLTRQ